jgi:hypothetical protein
MNTEEENKGYVVFKKNVRYLGNRVVVGIGRRYTALSTPSTAGFWTSTTT